MTDDEVAGAHLCIGTGELVEALLSARLLRHDAPSHPAQVLQPRMMQPDIKVATDWVAPPRGQLTECQAVGMQVIAELGGMWAPIAFPEGPAGPKQIPLIHWWPAFPVKPSGQWLGVPSKAPLFEAAVEY